MSQYDDDDASDLVISSYTIIAIVSFVIGGLIEKYVFLHQPPTTVLSGVVCLFLLFDAINGLKNRVKKLEGKVDAILKKLNDG